MYILYATVNIHRFPNFDEGFIYFIAKPPASTIQFFNILPISNPAAHKNSFIYILGLCTSHEFDFFLYINYKDNKDKDN